MKQTKIIITLLSIFFTVSAFSQDGEYVTVRDLETWTSFNFNYKVSKKFKFGIEQQFRFGNNSTEINDYITELNAQLKFTKHFYAATGFRYMGYNDRIGEQQGYENYFRWNLDVGVKHDIKRFSFDYRLRYQVKDQIGVSKDEGDYLNNHFRFKFGLGYNIKKWKLDPEVSAEIFNHMEKGVQNGWDKFRVTAGTKYKTKKFGDIGLFYRMELELNAAYPKTTNIIGLKYTYTLKTKK